MFVYSVKTSKVKLITLCAAVAALAGALLWVLLGARASEASQEAVISYRAGSAQERLAFIAQFGWQVAPDPVEVSEVILPEVYDAAFAEYVEMNQAQGLDLTLYRGARAKRWTYAVLNYPGFEDRPGTVELNLLIYDGRVIGGDLCSLEQDGFLCGFDGGLQAKPQPQTAAPPATDPAGRS
ncbi:MAG: DUF4830 domain-containing protein [Clostridia bacterium]|nr:DUF4830 domain-containing protein [Clostridia bacterium]